MRALYFDAFSGISGDLTVGALLALGVELRDLEARLAGLPVRGYRLRVSKREINGIDSHKFDVDVETGASSRHSHRSFREIRTLLQTSDLRPTVKEKSLAIFARLADAEGRVHGAPPDEVTFHEVGAVDSIVDIVATAIGLDALAVDRVYVSSLPLGSGTVQSRHGVIPVPSPATVELLKGFNVRIGDGNGELVTPTGAAIIAALAVPGEPVPALRIEAVGYGAGTRALGDRPNVLRLMLGSLAAACTHDEMVVVETNIDDASPELHAFVMEQLLAAGARDVWFTAAQMKKNRPGTTLHVLADPSSRDTMAAIILRETSTIGVRFTPVQRLILPRDEVRVETEFGTVPVKRSRAPDGTINLAPEYEACKVLARGRDVPLKEVYQAALAAARQLR